MGELKPGGFMLFNLKCAQKTTGKPHEMIVNAADEDAAAAMASDLGYFVESIRVEGGPSPESKPPTDDAKSIWKAARILAAAVVIILVVLALTNHRQPLIVAGHTARAPVGTEEWSRRFQIDHGVGQEISDGKYEKVATYLKFGGDPNARNSKGQTLLLAAIDSWTSDSLDRRRTIELLLKAKADPNAKDEESNREPLRIARGDDIDLLLDYGAKLDPDYGGDVMNNAASCSTGSTLHRLVKMGVDINAKNILGETAAHAAAASGRVGILEHLVALGADLNIRSDKHETPLTVAANNMQEKAAEYIQAHGGKN